MMLPSRRFFCWGGGGLVLINVNPRTWTYSAEVRVHSQATQCWSPLQLHDMQSGGPLHAILEKSS